ncbi:MAG: hypothetical protein U0T69_00140 [Chitinophagales bacterium]
MKYLFLHFFFFLFFIASAQDTIPVLKDSISIENIDKQPTMNDTLDLTLPKKQTIAEPIAITPASIIEKKKKFSVDKVRILFGINYSYLNPVVTEKDIYQGVYYPVKDSSPVWTERNTKNNLAKSYRSGNFQFSIQGNFWKGLFVGMNYQFFTVRKYKKDPNLGNLLSKTNSMFFIVSAQFGYVFEFLKNKALQIHPSVRIGGYTADDYYDSGKGKKFYFGTDLQIRYLIKRKAGFSLGFDYDFLQYKKKDYNDIFQRATYQKTTFSNIHLNAGVYFNVSINTKK